MLIASLLAAASVALPADLAKAAWVPRFSLRLPVG